jgi:hypothetical protein
MTTNATGSSTGRTSDRQEKGTQGSMTHLPGMHVPGVHDVMPGGTAGRVLWWGGLAALAAFGVVDWPVAVLVGAGSWVAEQYAKAAQRPGGDRENAS